MHKAAQGGHIDIVRFLVSMDATVNIRDSENFTPLLLAAGNPETPNYIQVVKELINSNGDVDATDDGSYSGLHLAVSNSNYEISKILLDAKCDVNHYNYDKFTPLHTAATMGHQKLVELLLQYGANPTLKDARGVTPIDIARKKGISMEVLLNPEIDQLMPGALPRPPVPVLPHPVTPTPPIQELPQEKKAQDEDSDALLKEIDDLTHTNTNK
uniref:Uncharacterized protein n=1 Tax=Arcella intermedia TaxID=1963864 RepID=A0A6B2LIQ6_9EUKA